MERRQKGSLILSLQETLAAATNRQQLDVNGLPNSM